MIDLSPEFIERYQLILEKDPKSKLFAPLAEAYRKMNLHEEAERLCKDGIKNHPHFPSGHVVYAKVLLDKGDRNTALIHLKMATDLSPENILAQRLLANTFLEMRQPKEALRAYKMVLLLNPTDETATKNVKKLESLTADEYDDELFEMKPLKNIKPKIQLTETKEKTFLQSQRALERMLSLVDAYVVRADFDRALSTLETAENELGHHPEIDKRRRFLLNRNADLAVKIEESQKIKPLPQDFRRPKELQISALKKMLQRVSDRRVE